MEYFTLKDTGLSVSAIGLGTWVFGGDSWNGANERDCLEAVAVAADFGVNLIDTAPIYGHGVSESVVGKAIAGKRDRFVVATKCGLVLNNGRVENNLRPESIQKELEQSLKRLKTDHVDLYQCHWPDPDTPIEDTMAQLLRLKKEGKLRCIGVSNFQRDQLKESDDLCGVVTLQNQYSLLERSIEKEIKPFCVEKDIGIMGYGPLGGGILSGKYKSHVDFSKGDARHFFYKYYKGEAFKRCQKYVGFIESFERPVNQIAINWVRQQQGVASVLVGCRNKEQARSNFASSTWDLTERQLQDLSSKRLSDMPL